MSETKSVHLSTDKHANDGKSEKFISNVWHCNRITRQMRSKMHAEACPLTSTTGQIRMTALTSSPMLSNMSDMEALPHMNAAVVTNLLSLSMWISVTSVGITFAPICFAA